MIKLTNINKIYLVGKTPHKILENINLAIEQGEFIAIVGPSGSGKSTLLNLIGGLDKPTSGDVQFFDKNLTKMSDKELSKIRREYMGFIFQLFNLMPNFTVLENLLYSLFIKRKDINWNNIKNVTQILNIEKLLQKKCNQLSGGEMQRAAIARAIIGQPAIILADEPTANLDSKNGSEVIHLLCKLQQDFQITVILVTHEHSLIPEYARKVYILDGKLQQA